MGRYRRTKSHYYETKEAEPIHAAIEEYLVANNKILKQKHDAIESLVADYNNTAEKVNDVDKAKYAEMEAVRTACQNEIKAYINSNGHYVKEVEVRDDFSRIKIEIARYVKMEMTFGDGYHYKEKYEEKFQARLDEISITEGVKYLSDMASITAMYNIFNTVLTEASNKVNKIKEEYKNMPKVVAPEDKYTQKAKIEVEARIYANLLQEAIMEELSENGLSHINVEGHYMLVKGAAYNTSKQINSFKRLNMSKAKWTFMNKEYNNMMLNVSKKNIAEYAVVVRIKDSYNAIVFMEENTYSNIIYKLANF